jgi:hypothetical protein
MKVTEIRYERLINIGHFSHVKGSAVVALDDFDSSIDAFAMARRLVKAQISEEMERQEELPRARPAPPPADPRDDLGDCPKCGGTGTVMIDDRAGPCENCGGPGDEIPF